MKGHHNSLLKLKGLLKVHQLLTGLIQNNQLIKVHPLLKGLLQHNQLLEVHPLLKGLLLLKGMLKVHPLPKGLLLIKVLKVLLLKVHILELKLKKQGKGSKNKKCLQHNQKVQMARKRKLLLELRVLFQPNSRNLIMFMMQCLSARMKFMFIAYF